MTFYPGDYVYCKPWRCKGTIVRGPNRDYTWFLSDDPDRRNGSGPNGEGGFHNYSYDPISCPRIRLKIRI